MEYAATERRKKLIEIRRFDYNMYYFRVPASYLLEKCSSGVEHVFQLLQLVKVPQQSFLVCVYLTRFSLQLLQCSLRADSLERMGSSITI